MDHAFTRAVSPLLRHCELTHLTREPIDAARAVTQHEAYEAALRDLRLAVRRIAPAPDHADGVFVEDAAVILEDLAVIARPGAASRRGEVEGVAAALAPFRPLARMPAPCTLDGGDVLVAGRTLFVGATGRTNAAGHAWLRETLEPRGYDIRVVPVSGCLHLKTAVTRVGPGAFLLNPAWVRTDAFAGATLIPVDPAEPYAANALVVGSTVLMADGAARTRERLESRGFVVRVMEISELAKAEAGVTCCSLVVPAAP
jgi:dimethylargininase